MRTLLFLFIFLMPYLSFASDTIRVGDNFNLSIVESGAKNVKLIGFTMAFDSSKIFADTTSEKPKYSIGNVFVNNTPTTAVNFLGDNTGTITAFIGFMNDSTLNKDGKVITFYFTAIDSGNVEFNFIKYEVKGSNNNVIPSIWDSYSLPIVNITKIHFYILIQKQVN